MTQTFSEACFQIKTYTSSPYCKSNEIANQQTFPIVEDSTDSFKGGETGRNQYYSDRHHGEVTKFKTCVRDQYFKQMSL